MLLLPSLLLQAGDTLSVSVSLKPTTDMVHRLAKYLVATAAAGSAAEGAAAAAGCENGDGSDEAEVSRPL